MEEAKKRGGRPAKVQESTVEQDGGEIAAENETTKIPKKRGRPAKSDKPDKVSSGRGRGRPAKAAAAIATSEDDHASPTAENGNASAPTKTTGGRGRPPKSGKLKLPETVVATGKGRGRPKGPPKSGTESDEPSSDADSGERTVKKNKAGPKPKAKPGRPKKPVPSDDESDEFDERRTVGRPAITGAVNLNIERTGRGQGRPKKRTANNDENGASVPKKRGRPTGTTKAAATATAASTHSGKRGRPKLNAGRAETQNDDDDDDDDDEEEQNNAANKNGSPDGGSASASDESDEPLQHDNVENTDNAEDAETALA